MQILQNLASGGMVPAPAPAEGLRAELAGLPTEGTQNGLIPWAAVTSEGAAQIMGPDALSLIGFQPDLSPEEQIVALGLRQRTAPLDLLASSPETLGTINSLIKSGPGRTDVDEPPVDDGPGTTTTQPKSPLDLLSAPVKELFNTIVEGFKTARYETHWWGYRIGFSPEFCKAFPKAVLGAEGPLLLKALGAFLGASGGIFAGISAAAVAVGGWIIAAILAYGILLAGAIALNCSDNGVWVLGIWATVVPIWAQRR